MNNRLNAVSTTSQATTTHGHPCYASLPLTAFDLLERTPSEIATLAASCGIDARQGV